MRAGLAGMRITVRSANSADRGVLLDFIRQLQNAERDMHPSRLPGEEVAELCYRRLIDQPADILIAESTGGPIGFVAGWLAEDEDPLQTSEWRRHGFISDLFVAAEYRGKGVAQRLLQAISDRLQDRGARRLRICAITVNDPAIAAYRRFGFEPFEITFDKPLS